MDGYVLKPEVRTALAAKLAAVPAGSSSVWLQPMRDALVRRHWPRGAAAAVDVVAPPPAVEAPQPAARASLIDQVVQLSSAERAALVTDVVQRSTEWMRECDSSSPAYTATGQMLAAVCALMRRQDRAWPPDVHRPWPYQHCESMWAFDLDTITELPCEIDGCRILGYTRILQIVSKHYSDVWSEAISTGEPPDELPPCATVVTRPGRVKCEAALAGTCTNAHCLGADRYQLPPHWAGPLADWYTKWAERSACRTAIIADWRDCKGGSGFWASHECRVWQFPEPRCLPDDDKATVIVGDMEDLHDFLTAWDRPCTTFSSSLCKSGVEMLGDTVDGKWLPAEVRALLPFYEPMRREQMRRRAPPPPPEDVAVGEEQEGDRESDSSDDHA